jgi:hypothetical protein
VPAKPRKTEAWAARQPADATKLWRYISFGKYVDMLVKSSLHFARADLLEDHFEGARGKGRGRTNYYQPPNDYGTTAPREKFYINSWYMGDFEESLMWTRSRSSEAIALRSNFRRLRAVLPGDIITGCIDYARYKKSNPELAEDELRRYFTKRRQFRGECELRAVDNSDRGREMPGVLHRIDVGNGGQKLTPFRR